MIMFIFPVSRRLVHAVFGIPGALFFADVDDLADVVGVVGADVREGLGGLFQLGIVGGFHPLFEFVHHVIELLHDAIPRLAVKFVEGLFIVAAECVRLLALEACKILPVPKNEVIGELPGRAQFGLRLVLRGSFLVFRASSVN
jgi:hypothetical protein